MRRWEYKVFSFGSTAPSDELLARLSAEGWEVIFFTSNHGIGGWMFCKREMMELPPNIVHHLVGGFTPCGMEGQPGVWPKGNFWSHEWDKVTCEACIASRNS